MRTFWIGTATIVLLSEASAGQGWTGYRTILSLETTPSGLEIRLAGFGGACTELNNGQETWAKITLNQANDKQLAAMVLMAFAAGKQIDVYCSSAAQWASLDNVKIN